MKFIYILFTILFVAGCADKEVKPSIEIVDEKREVYDLKNIPQNIEFYTRNINLTRASYINTNKYEKSYFTPWNIDKSDGATKNIEWAFNAYKAGKTYGENLQLLKKDFFDEMYIQANFENYLTLNRKAITLKHLNIRAFPSSRPLLLDPTLAGEGFPFDYLQNSTLQANKPVFVTHYSKDGEWVHIFSSFTYGWIKSDDIAFLEKENTDLWQNAQQIYIIKENVSLYSQKGDFLFKSKIGTMLPIISEDESSYTVLVVSSYIGSNPLFVKAKISKDIAKKNALAFNNSNVESIINEMHKSNYGWGGMYGQRDCSSMLRDFYAPFGLWLPRNSSKQSQIGEVISFKGLSDTQKIQLIKDKAIPFKTLLYKRGHIMLYVGTYKDEVVIFHDTWGIKTKKDGVEGRVVIGRAVFSTLKLGSKQKYYDESSELLRNLKSMNILNF